MTRGDDDPHAELTYWAAEELGMINPPPPSQESYDFLLILGGLATGVEPRVRYAAQLVEGGLQVRHQIAALGSFRPLQERELSISSRYSPHGMYEIDHLSGMLDALFRVDGPWTETTCGDLADDPARASLVAIQPRLTGPNLAAYAAASSDPDNRPANTADTYELFTRSNDLQPGQRMLVLTSAIYVPYQHLDAVRAFRAYDAEVETIGVRHADGGPTHKPSAYRQELRSALRSAGIIVGEL